MLTFDSFRKMHHFGFDASFDGKMHQKRQLPSKKCTFVNGGLWLVKKINVVFLLVYFPSMKWAGWP